MGLALGYGLGLRNQLALGGFKLPPTALSLPSTLVGTLLNTNGIDDVCVFNVEDLYRDINSASTITIEWHGRYNVSTALTIMAIGYAGGADNNDGISLGKSPTTNLPVLTITSESVKQVITFANPIKFNLYTTIRIIIDKIGLTACIYDNNVLIETKNITQLSELNLADSNVYIGASNPNTGFTAFQTGRVSISTNLTTVMSADSSQANEKFWFCSDGKNNHGKWLGTGIKLIYHKDAPTGIINGFTKWVNSTGAIVNVPHYNGVKQNILAFTNGEYQEAVDYPKSSLYNQAPVLADFGTENLLLPLLTNRITNGTFDSATGWVGGNISGGTCSFVASGGGVYRSDIPFVQGHRYVFKVKFSSFTAGTCGIRVNNIFISESIGYPNTFSSSTTYYVYYTHAVADANVKVELRVRSTFTCVCDEFLCYDLSETSSLSLMDRSNAIIHNATSIAAKPDQFFTYRWRPSELDYRTYKGYYNNDYINRLFAKAILKQVDSEYEVIAISDIRYFATAPTEPLLSSMIKWIGFSGGLDISSPVTIPSLWNQNYSYPDIILGSSTGIYSKNTFTYPSSIDAIPNLFGRYNYDDGFSNQPILLICHGWNGNASMFTDAQLQQYSANGFFVVALGMRGRDGADGVIDASGREIQDLIDGINYVRNNFASKVSANKNIIIGFSGGAGNTYNAITKNPDTFSTAVAYFGMSDYGESTVDSWRVTNPSYSPSIVAAIGNISEVNKYKTRNTRVASLNYKQGWIYGFANTQDTLVDHVNTEHVKSSFESSSLNNYEFDLSDVIYGHGNFSYSRVSDIIMKGRYVDSWIYPASGSVIVNGFIKTKMFSIILDDMMSSVVSVTYNIETKSYMITPLTNGDININITQGLSNYSGIINGVTTIILS